MGYLNHFHFDNQPFSLDENYNYFYPRKLVLNVIEDLTRLSRFFSGIYLINGKYGTGKSVILQKFKQTFSNNETVITIKITDKTDVNQIIAKQLKLNSKHIDNIVAELNKLYLKGSNIIFIFDDVQKANIEQLLFISSLISNLNFIRIILCGEKTKKLFKNKTFSFLKKYIVKTYNITGLSFIESYKYLIYTTREALSIAKYKNVFSFSAVFMLSFLSGGNYHILNKLAYDASLNAYKKDSLKIKLKNVFAIILNNRSLIIKNIYFKIQKLFLLLMIILSGYFCSKIVIDRNNLIEKLNIRNLIKIYEEKIINSKIEKDGANDRS